MRETSHPAPQRAPRPEGGRGVAGRWPRRLEALLAIVLLTGGSAGLAAPCSPSVESCTGAAASNGAACACCAKPRTAPASPARDESAFAPASAGCTCREAPTEQPPVLATTASDATASAVARPDLLTGLVDDLPAPPSAGARDHGSGSPPGPPEPLHLRNRVLRI